MTKLDQLKTEFRLHNDGDTRGCAMAFAFPLCEVLYSRDEHDIPELMRFRPSPMGVLNDPDDSIAEILKYYDTETLESFGRLLNRLIDILKAQKRDY